jgi:RNA polymerase sigma factor FliA
MQSITRGRGAQGHPDMGGTPDPSEDLLVREHLPLVNAAVAQLAGRLPRYVRRDDLTSAAMFGLAQAARTYDDTLGVPFARYATVRIRGALLDELREEDWASRSVRTIARKADAMSDRLATALGRTPTTDEVAEALGVDVEILRANAADRTRALVLRIEAMPSGAAAEMVLPTDETARPDVQVLASEDRSLLRIAIANLPERLRAVVVGSFIEERTLREIADDLDISESRASQMRSEALSWLREGMATLSGERPGARDASVGGRAARRRDAYLAALEAPTAA